MTCDNCGISYQKGFFTCNPISKHNFCSYSCKGEWQKENLRRANNPFYGHYHTDETKDEIGLANKGNSYRLGKKTPQMEGENNPAYVNGFWMIRNKHKTLYQKNKCDICNSTKKLEIHHEPFMDETNCLNWNGKIYTLCRIHHMERHRGIDGKMMRIYE